MQPPYIELGRGKIYNLELPPEKAVISYGDVNSRSGRHSHSPQSETGRLTLPGDTFFTFEVYPGGFSPNMQPLSVASAEQYGSDCIMFMSRRSPSSDIRIVSLFNYLSNRRSRKNVVQLIEDQATKFHGDGRCGI